MSNDVVVISTSAPADRPGYRRDLLKCVCLPNGSPVWFTYRRRWIASELLRDAKTLINRRSLIVFCDEPANQGGQFHFIPVRYAVIKEIDMEAIATNDVNAYIGLQFALGDYVRYNNVANESLYWQNWMVNHSQADNYPRPKGHPEEGKGSFLLTRGQPSMETSTLEKASWSLLCSQLDNARTLQGCSFYRVTEIYNYAENQPNPTPVRQGVYRERSTRIFEAGKTYRVSLQFYLDPGKPMLKSIEARASNAAIKLSPMLVEHRGLITNASVIANVDKVYANELAALIVEDTKDTGEYVPRSEFLVMLRPGVWIYTVIFFLAFGTFLAGVSPEIIRNLSRFIGAQHPIVMYYQYVALAIKTIGAIMVGYGAFLGFRTLPYT
jgi:hypothetical protein